jgi:hypothetical protein
MATRYAVIKEADDGEQEIIDIKLMEGNPPALKDDDQSTAEEVPDGPKIGMVRGGPVGSVDGFGFREGDPRGPVAENEQETRQEQRDRDDAARQVERQRASREPAGQRKAEESKAAADAKSKADADAKSKAAAAPSGSAASKKS